jgi:hypothetical protein
VQYIKRLIRTYLGRGALGLVVKGDPRGMGIGTYLSSVVLCSHNPLGFYYSSGTLGPRINVPTADISCAFQNNPVLLLNSLDDDFEMIWSNKANASFSCLATLTWGMFDDFLF